MITLNAWLRLVTYWKLKIKTNIIECLTTEEIYELEDIIENYIKQKDANK